MAVIIDEIETDKYTLAVFECDCGFHLGLDMTYLDAVDNIKIACPNCEEILDTEEFDPGIEKEMD